jgi:hypothetical protein
MSGKCLNQRNHSWFLRKYINAQAMLLGSLCRSWTDTGNHTGCMWLASNSDKIAHCAA